jgi:hypothetical protein
VGVEVGMLARGEELCDTDEIRRCVASILVLSRGGSAAFGLGSDNACGRREDIVLDLLKLGFSSFVAVSASLGSGFLCSSFPYLSEAKYSSPLPNTT